MLRAFLSLILFSQIANARHLISDYQIGGTWGQHELTTAERQIPAVLATAYFQGGTAVYLGKFNGEHVIATNHHVCHSQESCEDYPVKFRALGLEVYGKNMIGSWSEIETTLVTIRVTPEQESRLLPVARNFDFNFSFEQGHLLFTTGFGLAGNEDQRQRLNADSDCRVLSRTNESRFIEDPDTVNPFDYRVWSIVHGCDISHGDSGSGLYDRETGRLVGLNWTAQVPMNPDLQSSAGVTAFVNENYELIWTQLAYSSPAFKIREILMRALERNELRRDKAAIVREILR